MKDELFDQNEQSLIARGYRFWNWEHNGKMYAKREGKYILKANITFMGTLQFYKPMKANNFELQTL